MVNIVWTEESKNWLNEIYLYISNENPIAAKNVINGIYDKAQILRSFPEIGYSFEHESKRKIRIILYGHYRIAYEIINQQNIAILGVFHGKMILEKHLTI